MATSVATLRLGASGAEVKKLQQALADKGFNPGAIDGKFGLGTESAVMAFQRSEGLLADGVAGPRTQAVLAGRKPGPLPPAFEGKSDAEVLQVVARMFPHTPIGNIKANLPPVLEALSKAKLIDRLTVLMALATVRAETESFEPLAEGRSRYNTSPGGHPFDLYDFRADLGNGKGGDGERYRGRGYVQLTGKDNYRRYGKAIGLGNGLVSNPDAACEPEIAGKLLAAFIGSKEIAIKEALLDQDLARARRLVNGGSHGLDRFSNAYRIGIQLTA
jgi:putative chitinase